MKHQYTLFVYAFSYWYKAHLNKGNGLKELKATQLIAIIIACIVFCITGILGVYWTHSMNSAIINQQVSLLNELSHTQAAVLERKLSSAFTASKILAYEIEHHKGDSSWFPEYADKLLQSISDVDSLHLAPDGIISQFFPIEGNELAIGLDILSRDKYKEEGFYAIKKQQFVLVGPVELVQGGTAIIGRAPVFLYSGTQREVFWGFVSSVIYLDNLLASTQLQKLEERGYQYNLSRVNIGTEENLIIASSTKPLTEIQITAELITPSGEWNLTISKELDVQLEEREIIGYTVSITIAFLLAVALYIILIQPQRLRALVKAKTKELEELAYQDPLTSLPNRRYLQDTLPRVLYNNQHRKRISAFIYFDLDNFKHINDTIGHDIGDKVLVVVANRLSNLQKKSDLVIRLGGDEFGILLGNIKSNNEVEKQADQILESIRTSVRIDNSEYSLSTSLGIAMIPEHGYDLVTIMKNADMALYQAKLDGKNRYAFYNESMKINTYTQIQDEYDLSQAIQGNEFELYYQPQFNLHTDKIIAAEALIRWNHPEKGLVFPDDFIPLAETTGKIIELGYWILESSIAYLARRKKEGKPEILLHINLSSKQLSDPNFVTLVQDLLVQYDVSAKLVGFEITETLILEDVELAKQVLQIFKEMGICIAIDDFGTGYSSLAQLKNLPVTLLKIDRSFVMDLENDIDDRKIIEAIIAMAHKLNIQVLAEGIETREQWNMLASFHCNYGQGYYVSKAITADQFNLLPQINHDNL